jgi:serine/threonine protein kinase
MDPADHLLEQILTLPERDWERALADSNQTHPALAAELRRRFEVLRESGLVAAGSAVGTALALPQRLGEFTPVRVLGEGGMGIVYEARQDRLGRNVALKVVRPAHLLFDGAGARFRREIEAVARLSHPGIVAVYGVGDEGDVPFFAMELLRGASLDLLLRALAERAPESLTGADLAAVVAQHAGESPAAPAAPDALFHGAWSQVCIAIGTRLAHALAHAHAHGIVHRDLKPSNVIVTPQGRVVLVDFGLAVASGVDRLTRMGTELGSLPYLAPETLRGALADAKSDQYALALLLYELLALRHPFPSAAEPQPTSAKAA